MAGLHGWDIDDTFATVVGSVPLVPGSWALIEMAGLGYGTASGQRKLWVNGVFVTSTAVANWVGISVHEVSVGLVYVGERQQTGVFDFDDVRLSTTPPASILSATTSAPVVINTCVPVTVSLLSSEGGAATAPYEFSASVSATGVAGSTYAEIDCSGATVNAVTLPSGASSATLYFRPTAVGLGTLRATHVDFVSRPEVLRSVTGEPLSPTPASRYAAAGSVRQLSAKGGAGQDYTWSLLSNLSGASLSAAGLYTAGAVTGVTDTVQVRDATGGESQGLIHVIPPPSFLSTGADAARCGSAYRYSESGVPSVEGQGELTYSLGAAGTASGVEVDPASGEIHWTPTRGQVGEQSFALVVADQGGMASQPLTITVDCPSESALVGCACGATGASGLGLIALLSGARTLLPRRRQRGRSLIS
jgi:hypothetical protein